MHVPTDLTDCSSSSTDSNYRRLSRIFQQFANGKRVENYIQYSFVGSQSLTANLNLDIFIPGFYT